MSAKDIPGFRQFDFPCASIAKTVYWKAPEGSSVVGKPVLVMHELPGLTEFATRFAQRLVDAGFTVYLPLLFGEPLKRDVWGYSRQLCISQEFARLRAGVSAPITDWLRALARELSSRHQGACVGTIGMCLTGGFVIPLILEPVVTAPVASQPSVPYSTIYWKNAQTRCVTFLKWRTSVSIESTVSTRMRSFHSPRRHSLRGCDRSIPTTYAACCPGCSPLAISVWVTGMGCAAKYR